MAGAPFWGGASAEGPTFAEDPWDIVFIGGDPLPGLCEVKAMAALEVDKKKTKGSNGVTITIQGLQPQPFEVTVRVWTQDQWDFLQAWIDKFWNEPVNAPPPFTKKKVKTGTDANGAPQFREVRTPTRKPQVKLEISHPSLSAIGITTCVLLGVPTLDDGSEVGVKICRIRFFDGRLSDKKNATKTAKGAIAVTVHEDVRNTSKASTPAKPSTDRTNLGPKGPKPTPGGGSD